ncbi:MAG: ABC transporter ATP-binding protein [Gammaproteobacteria bacterium]
MKHASESFVIASTHRTVIELECVSKSFQLFESSSTRAFSALAFWRQRANRGIVGVRTALKDVTLKVECRERVGLVGHNGSGKTTLLNLILGLSVPTAGMVRVRGRAHGLMSVGSGYDDGMTGRKVIHSLLMLNNLSRSEEREATRDIEEFVELGEFLDHPVRTYSLGMRARLEFAVATAIAPDVLAVDEVLGAGDGYFAQKSARRMRAVAGRSTLLLVSHSMRQILDYCERAIWLNEGVVEADGPAEEVVKAYEEFMMRKEAAQLDRQNSIIERKADDVEGTLSHMDSTVVRLASQRLVPAPRAKEKAIGQLIDAWFLPSKSRIHVTETGALLTVAVRVWIPTVSRDQLGIVLLAFGPSGQLLWDARVEPQVFGSGERTLLLEIAKATPGVGDYLITIVLEKQQDEQSFAPVDCLHGALKLRMITTNYSDPPVFHCAGEWRYGSAGERRESSRVSAWV